MRPLAVFALAPVLALMLTAPAKSDDYEYSIEGQASRYRYVEPDLMSLEGNKLSLAGRVLAPLDNDRSLIMEGRIAYGLVDYQSVATGNDNDEPDTIVEFRLLLGNNINLGSLRLLPYLGYGFRTLVNDSQGVITTTGHAGYLRISRYHYLPLGVEIKANIFGGKTTLQLEIDQLLVGTQESYLPGETIINRQKSGRGFLASLMFSQGNWAAGPYNQEWKIASSDSVSCDLGQSYCTEPRNQTRETGFRLRYTFER